MRDHDEFNGRFCRISDRMEKWVCIAIVALSALLIVGQVLLKQVEPVRVFLIKTIQLEGTVNLPGSLRQQ